MAGVYTGVLLWKCKICTEPIVFEAPYAIITLAMTVNSFVAFLITSVVTIATFIAFIKSR